VELQQPSHLRRLAQAATLVMVFFVLSRVLGLARDIIITRQFGTSREYEAYLAAFRIPDFIYQVVASGALGSAFIPIFSTLLAHGDTRRSWQLASHVINLVLLVITGIAVLTAVFADPIVRATVAVGFSPADQALTAHLMRIMLLTPIVFGVSGIVMGILNSFHHFLLPALAPVLYNVGIILGALFLAPNPAFGVYGLALGVILGALLHLLVQLPWLIRARMSYSPHLGLNDGLVREVLRLMLPRTAGIAAVQVNFLFNTILASTLPEGRLAALWIAWTVTLLPWGIIAQPIATVLFPTFSQFAARGDEKGLREAFSTGFRITLFLTIPASLGLILLSAPIIQLLYQRGEFTAESTAQTAFALQFYALGLFAHSGLEVPTRAFYALHDTATPVKVGVAAIALNLVLSILLLQPLAQGGLALANSIATALEMLALLYFLRARLGGMDGTRILNSLVKTMLASAAMALAILLWMNLAGHVSVWLLAFAAMALGGAVFFLVTLILRSEELTLAWRLARQRG
jgi:putative peptidoglycan lipid II flippase